MTDPYADAKLVDPLAGLPVQDVHALVADAQRQNEREGNWIPTAPPRLIADVTGFDDRTLDKVRKAMAAVGLMDDDITAAIIEMQNEGILFREHTKHTGEASDGYHTFNELYDHRRALTAVLATIGSINGDSWKSKQHHPDDKPMFDGYFIVGIELPAGQISYHYSLDFWGQFDAVPEHEYAPKWDGHTSGDVVERLFGFKDLLKQAIDEGHEVVGMAREAAERTVAAAQAEMGIDAHPVLDRPGKTRGADEVLG